MQDDDLVDIRLDTEIHPYEDIPAQKQIDCKKLSVIAVMGVGMAAITLIYLGVSYW